MVYGGAVKRPQTAGASRCPIYREHWYLRIINEIDFDSIWLLLSAKQAGGGE